MNPKNIGIVTLPFYKNYGGVLQCFALKRYLENNFCAKVYIIKPNITQENIIKHIIRIIYYKLFNIKEVNTYYSHYQNFIFDNFKFLTTKESIKTVDTIICGSDQIWRKDFFNNCYLNFYCDFARKNKKIRKISYAASFGLDNWGYNKKETKKIQRLVSEFSAISVREESGIKLCTKYLNINPLLVLDPTLLLAKDEYLSFIKKNDAKSDLFIYWLGENKVFNEIIAKYSKKDRITSVLLRDDSTLCDIEEWLSNIYNTNLVITDSFHGCVFSILFQKQFWVLPNNGGGLDRIKTLLDTLGLNHRFVNDINEIDNMDIIDYSIMDKLLNNLKKVSIKFIKDNI